MRIALRIPQFLIDFDRRVTDLWHTTDGIGRPVVGIGTGFLILFITWKYIDWFIAIDWVLQICLALIITSVIYFPLIFPHATIDVPPNKGWILANRFVPESKKIDRRTGFREVRAQTEKQASLHWKYFWEFFSEEVDMKREIPVKGDPKEAYTLKGGSFVNIEYQIAIFPLPGYLVNFVKMKEEDIKRRVQTRAERCLQEFVGRFRPEQVTYDRKFMDRLQRHFVNVFGGPHVLDEEEIAMGIWTGTPEVFDINPPAEVEKGKTFEQRMDSIINVARKMVQESGGNMSWDQAYRVAYAMEAATTGKLDFIDVAGLVGLGGNRPKPKNAQQGGRSGNPRNN
jgi:hypothetical protein